MTAIDFARSTVTWLLPEQPSYGRFAIDASLTLPDLGETFHLCAQVFAGDVYGEGELFKDPPYEYSATFSRNSYRIFRDVTHGPALEDSWGQTTSRFRELHVDIKTVACHAWDARGIAGVASGRLSARLRMAGSSGLARAELEFPVRHINVNLVAGRFQVETGPVLVVESGEGDPVLRLRRAYVMFGRSDRAEFLIDSPRGAGERWPRRIVVECACEIVECQA